MNQAEIRKNSATTLIVAAFLSSASQAALSVDVPVDNTRTAEVLTASAEIAVAATDFVHAPRFSEAEKRAVRAHYGIARAATISANATQEAQTLLQAGESRRALPRELMITLPRRDSRFIRLLVKNDIVLMDRLTGFVLDVIPDVTCSASCARPGA